MKKLIPAILILTITFSSCIKEYPAGPNGPQGVDSTGLLKKMVTISLPDSQYRVTQEFAYDVNGRLLAQSFSSNNGSSVWVYNRDGLGRIRIISSAHSHNNWDTVYTGVTYVSGTSNQVAYLSDSSAVFHYNSAGKITRTDTYARPSGSSMKLVVYHLYTYDGNGNLIKREEYNDADNDGLLTLSFTYLLEYDSKENPLYPIDDALVGAHFLTLSPNNLVRQVNDPAHPGTPNDENLNVYDFRPDNKPQTSLFTSQDGRQTKTYYYYY